MNSYQFCISLLQFLPLKLLGAPISISLIHVVLWMCDGFLRGLHSTLGPHFPFMARPSYVATSSWATPHHVSVTNNTVYTAKFKWKFLNASPWRQRNAHRNWQKVHVTIIIIIIIITTTIFIVLSCTAPAICESSLWFIWAKVGQRQVAANS